MSTNGSESHRVESRQVEWRWGRLIDGVVATNSAPVTATATPPPQPPLSPQFQKQCQPRRQCQSRQPELSAHQLRSSPTASGSDFCCRCCCYCVRSADWHRLMDKHMADICVLRPPSFAAAAPARTTGPLADHGTRACVVIFKATWGERERERGRDDDL